MGLFRQRQYGGGVGTQGGAPAASPGVSDHGTLTGLADDDHAQYLLLAGRAGGQTAIGGPNAADQLIFDPGNATGAIMFDLDAAATQQVLFRTFSTTSTADIQNMIQVNKGLTLDGMGRIAALTLSGTYLLSGDPNTVPFLVFNFNPTVKLQATTADLNTYRIFSTAGSVVVETVAAGNVGSVFTAYDWITAFTATGGGTAAFESGIGLKIKPTFDAGWTQRDLAGVELIGLQYDVNPTNQFKRLVAIDIVNMNSVTALTLRSAVAAAEMRHAGPAVFAANAAPTNASVGLEVQSTTKAFLLPRLTNAQIATLTGVAVADGMLVYCTDVGALIVGAHQRNAGAWAPI